MIGISSITCATEQCTEPLIFIRSQAVRVDPWECSGANMKGTKGVNILWSWVSSQTFGLLILMRQIPEQNLWALCWTLEIARNQRKHTNIHTERQKKHIINTINCSKTLAFYVEYALSSIMDHLFFLSKLLGPRDLTPYSAPMEGQG